MANKAQIKALEDRLNVAEQISEARKKVLISVMASPAMRGNTTLLHQADLAVRGMREGRTPSGNRMVEVAYGTPLACDPTSETYWSM